MAELLFTLMALLLFIFGLLLLTAEGFEEPTFWKFYFPPFYEESGETGKLLVYRQLKENVRVALSGYFILASLVIFVLLFVSLF